MVAVKPIDERLVSRQEIAQLTGVRRPTVTNWERRHPRFPTPHSSDGRDYFRLTQVLGWLDSRPIRPTDLTAAEAAGATYGDRARRNLTRGDRWSGGRVAKLGHAEDEESVGKLLDLLAASAGGTSSVSDYLTLVFSLVFLRAVAPTKWQLLVSEVSSANSLDDSRRLLGRIGMSADEEFRRLGLLPGMSPPLAKLQPLSPKILVRVIDLSGDLGRDAFRLLFDRYDANRGSRGNPSFTPHSVSRLMAQLMAVGTSAGQRIYDPYVRGGELLVAAAEAMGDRHESSSQVNVNGDSPSQDMLRIAGVNLAFHGMSAELKTSTSAPWENTEQTPRRADLIVSNPPFNASASTRSTDEDSWGFGPPPPGNDNFAWLQHILSSLDVGGRAAVVMPNNAAVSANPREQYIRNKLVDRGAVECVIGLPSHLFSTTTIPVSVWLLRYPTGSCDQVLFIDARQRGERARKQHILTESDRDEIGTVLQSWREQGVEYTGKSGFSAAAGIDEIADRNYSLSPTDYVVKRKRINRPAATSFAAFVDARAEEERLVDQASSADAKVLRLCKSIEPEQSGATWVRMPLHTLCKIQSGPSPKRLSDQRIYVDGAIPIVVPKHLRDRRIVAEEKRTVSHKAAEDLRRFRLDAGDIVCVRTGSTGPSALVETPQTGWLIGTNLLRLHDMVVDQVDPLYLISYLSLPDVIEWIRKRSTEESTAVPSIRSDSLGQLSVVLPPLPEQWRIGQAFKVFDEQIAAHRDLARATVNTRAMAAEHLMGGGLLAK